MLLVLKFVFFFFLIVLFFDCLEGISSFLVVLVLLLATLEIRLLHQMKNSNCQLNLVQGNRILSRTLIHVEDKAQFRTLKQLVLHFT